MALQFITPYSIRLGVVGAGTMGSGIALAALQAEVPVTLVDVSAEMLSNADGYIRQHLLRKGQAKRLRNLDLSNDLGALSGAGIVIEAVSEDLPVKRDLFARLDAICPPPAILASNTSTFSITTIASATSSPERVAGLHFFNPAPVQPLVEVVQAARSSPETILSLLALVSRLEKTPVVTRDIPGFIVNRVARPFYGEALRLLGEGTATYRQIDRLARLAGGFRMGPFELMDLIGIDINLAATRSMYEQTFGEPRYRPHPIQLEMVAQNALGRKTGRGFYSYDTPEPVDEARLAHSPAGSTFVHNAGPVFVIPGTWAPGILEHLRKHGYTHRTAGASIGPRPMLALATASLDEGLPKLLIQIERELPPDIPLVCQCADVTLTEIATWLEHPERLAGFDGLFFNAGSLATLVASPTLSLQARNRIEAFFNSLNHPPVWIQDSPALILPRIVCMLANEAAFAAGEGLAPPNKIDLAMRLGVSYPKGPLAWAKEIGYERVVAVLDHLHREYGEERYRVAPLLRRWARLEAVTS